jgi:hypothetical protein
MTMSFVVWKMVCGTLVIYAARVHFCEDPGRPADGIQQATSYEQGAEISFQCTRPGYIPITSAPIQCVREPECSVVRPIGITSGRITGWQFQCNI